MIIRRAVAGDAEAIRSILNPVIRDTTISFKPKELSIEDAKSLLRDAQAVFVAENGGGPVGVASYDQFRRGLGYARTMEHSIVLAPEARGQGAGRRLMQAIENDARSKGVGSMWAGVSAENPAGVAFHASVGFEEVARLPKVGFKFDRWLDLILMRKWLDPEGDDPAHRG